MTGDSRRTGARRWLPSRRLRAVVAFLTSTMVGTPVHVAGTQEAAAARTTIGGVYANEQADRGQVVYGARCESCHGATLEGGTLAPALKGGEFLSSFQGRPLRRIYSRIISTMPPDDVGSLTEAETLALVALVLRSNGYPAGREALVRADELNEIGVAPPPEKRDDGMWNAEAAETAENNLGKNIALCAQRALRSRSVR